MLELSLDATVNIPSEGDAAMFRSLAGYALKQEGAGEAWVVGLRFVDDREIQALHAQFMDIDSPTDILTFPYEASGFWGEQDESLRGGDIVISAETAERNAAGEDETWVLLDELSYLVLHGVLHLTGWDDTTPGMRRAMLARQHGLYAQWRFTAGSRGDEITSKYV